MANLFETSVIQIDCMNVNNALAIYVIAKNGKSQKYFVSRQEELGNLNGHIEEIYSGLNVVKVYNGKI